MNSEFPPLDLLNLTFVFKASRKIRKSSRIIDGSEVSEPVPWMVQLLDDDDEHMCGGVLLSARHILSAAHCLGGFSNYVVIGITSARNQFNVQETNSLKESIATPPLLHPMHEYFKDDEMSFSIYDFMMLFLETPLKNYCPHKFARLPNLLLSNENVLVDKTLVLNGWGSTLPLTREQAIAYKKGHLGLQEILSLFSYPLNLQKISLSYVRNRVCQRRHKSFLDRHHTVRGRKRENDEYTEHKVQNVRFGTGLALSMMCTSTCSEEDVSKCPHQHGSGGGCSGDSGCKLLL